MSLKLNEVASLLVDGNKTAFKVNASRRAGQMFNDRVAGMVIPKLPAMVRMSGATEQPWFKFLLANAVAGAIIKFGYTNDKLIMLADAGVNAANDDFLGSFDFEGMVNGLIDGIDVSGFETAGNTARQATASGLRKASDAINPDTGEVA